MTVDAETLSYQFEEEKWGFKEPARSGEVRLGIGEKISLALVGLGFLFIVVQLANGLLAATWPGFLLGFGPFALGSAAYFWFAYKNTKPGIKHDGITFGNLTARGVPGWTLGIIMTGFYVVVYWFPGALAGLARLIDPLSLGLTGKSADHWFLYSFVYTLAILVFGVRTIMKYRHNRYQIVRTISVMFFQLGLAFILPNILRLFHQPEFYFSYFWPLKSEYLFPSTVAGLRDHPLGFGILFVYWGAFMTFVGTPVLTYFYGKRWYCSWVCGCGGLAETLGDPWRQLSDKSTRAWVVERWLIHSVLVFVTVTTLALWINSATEGAVFGQLSGVLAKWYGFFIGQLFAGVVGVGFYPLMGNRVWCRFGCPMAAILGILQRCWSRFRITTNGGQCMSCGNCSTYCEMGIDVRAYAEKGENIVRASCVGCGVCSAVCPRGVLKLENGLSHKERFAGSDDPVKAFFDSIRKGPKIP